MEPAEGFQKYLEEVAPEVLEETDRIETQDVATETGEKEDAVSLITSEIITGDQYMRALDSEGVKYYFDGHAVKPKRKEGPFVYQYGSRFTPTNRFCFQIEKSGDKYEPRTELDYQNLSVLKILAENL